MSRKSDVDAVIADGKEIDEAVDRWMVDTLMPILVKRHGTQFGIREVRGVLDEMGIRMNCSPHFEYIFKSGRNQ